MFESSHIVGVGFVSGSGSAVVPKTCTCRGHRRNRRGVIVVTEQVQRHLSVRIGFRISTTRGANYQVEVGRQKLKGVG